MKFRILTILFVALLFLSFTLSREKHVVSGTTASQQHPSKHEIDTEFGKIKVDLGITSFKPTTVFDSDLGKKYIYSLHGEDDLKSNSRVTGFIIQPLKFFDSTAAKKYVEEFAADYGESDDIVRRDFVKKEQFRVEKIVYYVITFQEVNKQGRRSHIMLAVLSYKDNSVLFWSSDFEKGIYSDRFRKTILSVEFR